MRLIDEGYQLGCRHCQFIGGEPFMYRGMNGKTVLDLAEYAKEIGYEFVEIFTNATLLTHDKLIKIKDLGLHVAVSIYSHLAEVHDAITQIPGSHTKTMQALENLREFDIPTRVAVVLMHHNQSTIEQTREHICQMGFDGIKIDVVRPTGRGKDTLVPDKEIYERYALVNAPNFKATKKFVAQTLKENSCLAGKIVIVDNGDILPCIFGREWIIGNVRQSSLESVVDSAQMQKLWSFSKDLVRVCCDCEYRYICHDCRPLANAVNNRQDAPSPRCTYNPYTGAWGKGVWRIDSGGTFIYTQQMEESMQD